MPTEYAVYPCLSGQHVVITGGASGIGEALVDAFIEQGSQVSFLDVDEAAANLLISRYRNRSPRFLPCDVTDVSALRATLEDCESFAPIDCLINNAGNDQREAFFEIEESDWDVALDRNLKHQFFASQHVARYMRDRGQGAIINLGSISWMRGRPGMCGYTTSKAGIYGLTKTLARELGPDGIRVNSLVPGAILTERQERLWLTPELDQEFIEGQALKRRLVPSDVAALGLFLASAQASGCAGQSFVVDAGLTQN